MTQNLNDPKEFEAWCDSLTAEQQATYLASIQITSGPSEYAPPCTDSECGCRDDFQDGDE